MTDPVGNDVFILYVLDRFPLLSETFVSAEISELRTLGVKVAVATSRSPRKMWSEHTSVSEPGETPRAGLLDSHVRWARKSFRAYLGFVGTMLRAPVRDIPFMLWAPAVAIEAASWGTTHVHTHFAFRAASFARAVATLLGCGCSVTTHANDIFTDTRHLDRRLRGLNVLTVSEFNRTYLEGFGIASSVNHCGVDTDELAFVEPFSSRPIDILFVGRLVAKKGPLTFIKALGLLHEAPGSKCSAAVLGDGPLTEDCQVLAASLGLSVTFLGARPHEEVLRTISSAKIVCLPCQRAPDGDLDGIPVVLMESMALGTPVVTTPVSGIPELVTPECGWLTPLDGHQLQPPELATELAAALDDCLHADPQDLDARRRRARRQVEAHFGIRQQALGLLAAATPEPSPRSN